MNKETIILIKNFKNKLYDNIKLDTETVDKIDVFYKEFEIEDDSDKKLCVIKMGSNEEKNNYKKILQFVRNHITNLEGEKLILIHNKPDIKDDLLKTYFGGNIYCLFGDAIGLIYEKLIFQSNYLKKDAFVDGKLKKQIFDDIWEEYSLQNLKKKIYELKEELLIVLYPHSFDNVNFTLENSLKLGRKNVTLEERINNFIKNNDLSYDNFKIDKWRETLNKDKYKEKYEILKNKSSKLINKQGICLSTDYLTALNKDFNNLISSFEGISIY